LQIKVENGQLVIPAEFVESFRGVSNPVINQRAKKMLYLRYEVCGLEKVVVYDFSRRILVVPRDCV